MFYPDKKMSIRESLSQLFPGQPHEVLSLRGILSRIFPGSCALAFAFMLWNNLRPNPIESFCILQYGKSASAKVVRSYEFESEPDQGAGEIIGIVSYEFFTRDGRRVSSRSRSIAGGVPDEILNAEISQTRIPIEYCPHFPQWARIKGTGVRNISQWLLYDAFLGTLFLALALVPGSLLLSSGVRDIRAALKAPVEQKRVRLSDEEQVANRNWLLGWSFVVWLVTIAFIGPMPRGLHLMCLAVLGVLGTGYLGSRWASRRRPHINDG